MCLIQSIDQKTVVIAPNSHHFSFYFYLHTSLLLNMFLSSKFLNMFLCSVFNVYTYSVVCCFNAILFHYIYRYLPFFCVNVFYLFFIIVFIMQRHMVGSTFDRKIPFSVSSICILFNFFLSIKFDLSFVCIQGLIIKIVIVIVNWKNVRHFCFHKSTEN